MNLDIHWKQSDFELTPNKRNLTVLVLYDEPGTHPWAKLVYQHLESRLLADYEPMCTWIQVDQLKDPAIANEATFIALGAELIIFATNSDVDANGYIKDWVETWVTVKVGYECALVVLINQAAPGVEGTGPLSVYLGNLARKYHLDFMCQTLPLTQLEAPPLAANDGNWISDRPSEGARNGA